MIWITGMDPVPYEIKGTMLNEIGMYYCQLGHGVSNLHTQT